MTLEFLGGVAATRFEVVQDRSSLRAAQSQAEKRRACSLKLAQLSLTGPLALTLALVSIDTPRNVARVLRTHYRTAHYSDHRKHTNTRASFLANVRSEFAYQERTGSS